MKIYTKAGDDGSTGLFGGSRVSKSDPRIECVGAVDEINAAIGVAAVASTRPMLEQLRRVQHNLFVIGSHLATPTGSIKTAKLPPLEEDIVNRLESEIDLADAELPPLKNFILPGGTDCASRLHLARAVCRRAERLLVQHANTLQVSEITMRYLNRLSDWLFVLARLANHRESVADIPWVHV